MARITIEDCLEKFDNHFKVVQVASHRAHQIELGSQPLVSSENDKSTVIALREISEGKINEEVLDEPLIEKSPWVKDEQMLIQPQDLGQAIADIDSHADINEAKLNENNQATIATTNTDSQQSEASDTDTNLSLDSQQSEASDVDANLSLDSQQSEASDVDANLTLDSQQSETSDIDTNLSLDNLQSETSDADTNLTLDNPQSEVSDADANLELDNQRPNTDEIEALAEALSENIDFEDNQPDGDVGTEDFTNLDEEKLNS